MKKITLTVCLSFCVALSAYSQNYSFLNTTATYSDLTGTTSINNGEIWDDPAYTLALPFPIFVNNISVSSLTVTDGVIFQDTTNPIIQVLAPFVADLIDRGDGGTTSLSPISYKTEGTIGSRILKIEFKNCGAFFDDTLSMFVNFQIWYYESTRVIEYRYGTNLITDPTAFYDTDSGSIIGFTGSDTNDNLSNTHFLTGAASNPTLSTANSYVNVMGTPPANTVYRFTPTTLATDVITKSSIVVYPNPFKDDFIVSGLENNYGYTMYDLKGMVVQAETVKISQDIIKTTNLAKGIYFLKIVTENETIIKKVIKD